MVYLGDSRLEAAAQGSRRSPGYAAPGERADARVAHVDEARGGTGGRCS